MKIKNEIEEKIEEKIDKVKKKGELFKTTIETKIDELSMALLDLSNRIKDSKVISKDENYEANKYIYFNLQFPKISYDNNINLENINQNLIGGCLPEINHNIKLNEIIMNEDSYKLIKENKNDNYNFKDKYYIIKSKLKQGFIFDHSILYSSLTSIDSGQKKIVFALHKNNFNPNPNLKDYNGATLTHYKMFFNDENNPNFISENELNIKDYNGLRPEIYAITSNDTKIIKRLFTMKNSDFSSNIYDVASPFLLAILTQNRKMINIFLDNYNKLGDLNYPSENKNTPLHYLCLLNMPEESFNLLQKIDRLDIVNEREGNNPLHILCINSNYETLKKMLNYGKIDNYIKLKRYDGKTLLHLTCENSILCTDLLLMKNIDMNIKDNDNITPLEYAFFSGRYDCFNKINNKNKNNLNYNNLNKSLNVFLKSISRKKNNDKIRNNMKHIDVIVKEIKTLLKQGNISEITQFIENNKKYNIIDIPFNDFKICKKIVNCACKIGNTNNIPELLKLINHKTFPIAPFVGKYGLIKWLNDIVNYGIDLFQCNKKVLNFKTIFDICVESNNSKLYKLILRNIEETNTLFKTILSNNFVEALLTKKKSIVKEIISQLEKPKFRNMKLSIEKLSQTYKTTSNILNYSLNLNFINPQSLDIYSAVKYCRPSVLRIILSLKSNEINKECLEKLLKIIKRYNRLDNLLVLNEKSNINELYPNLIDMNIINKILMKIENLAQSPKTFAEDFLIKKMEKINKKWNIGLMELPLSNTFLLHSFFKHNNFWILDCLDEPFKSDLLIQDEKGITAFGYIRIFDDDFFNKYLIKIINFLQFQKKSDREKAKDILDALNIINNVVNRDKYEDEYICKLFDIIENISYIYLYTNKHGDNILHIITKIKNIKKVTIEKIVNNFNILKRKNIKSFTKLINAQNNEGETPIMNIVKSSNMLYIDSIINEFKEEINFDLFNIENDNLLHLLFLNIKLDKITYIDNKNLFNILKNIFSKNTGILLQQNNKLINPCVLSSISGCNISLFLIHCIYSKEIIEKYNFGLNALCQACKSNNINTVRYLIEYLNYDINYKVRYNSTNYDLYKMICDDDFLFPELSTPLHISGYFSSLEIAKYLINNGANPFLLDKDNNDALSIMLENGNEEMLSYLFSTKLVDINNNNDKYLLSLIKNKNGNKYFEPVLYKNLGDNIFIVDDDLNNLIMLSCLNKNPEIIEKLLDYDFDFLAKNKHGLNFLHICCYKDSYSCAGIIMEFLYKTNQMDIIYELIISKNLEGETPLHIVSDKNRYSLAFLLLSYLL